MNGGGGETAGMATAAAATTTGPRAKCDQVIFEALAKATEIIVASRGGGGGGGNNNNNNNNGVAQPKQPTNVPWISLPSSSSSPPPSSSSSRFNLTLPENPHLRQILQKWRRALHLPLRLDVYYEHDDQRRELLERWCLGYVMGDAFWRDQQNTALFHNNNKGAGTTTDPIVQLRHVCKKLVIWLRTLYCFARLLPSTAFLHTCYNNNIKVGFSLYAVSEDTNDISQLKQQGFLYQGQPSPAVTTPYGQLGWQVLYASGNAIQHLLPQKQTTFLQHQQLQHQRTTTRTSKAIPILAGGGNRQEQEQQHNDHHFDRIHPHETLLRGGGIPQTAPAHMNHYLLYERGDGGADSYRGGTEDYRQVTGVGGGAGGTAFPQQNTYNPSFFTSGRDRMDSNQRPLPTHGIFLQRRHTSIGQETEAETSCTNNNNNGWSPGQEKPHRVFSGLSLALMSHDAAAESRNRKQQDSSHNLGPALPSSANDESNTEAEAAAAAEKRRAALHQMPPHLLQQHQQQQQPQQTRSTSNEYGYAYNNHIPRQFDPPFLLDTGTPTPPLTRESMSPSPLLGTTPPLGVFMGGNPSSFNNNYFHSGLTGTPLATKVTLPGLLPPRNSGNLASAVAPAAAASVTPPFPPRPVGFIQDRPPSALNVTAQKPPRVLQEEEQQQQQQQQQPIQRHDAVDAMTPLTSLDMLHHSPFLHHPSSGAHQSMLSSLSGVGPVFGSEAASLFYNSAAGGDLRKSSNLLSSSSAHYHHHHHPQDEYEEMPFAVCDDVAEHSTSSAITAGSHALASSATVASFAQKCSVHQRLEFFDQQASEAGGIGIVAERGRGGGDDKDNDDRFIADLAEQLADFRSFGASLRLGGGGEGGSLADEADKPVGTASAGSNTPIALRS